jgi:hypothetical protein
VAHAYLLGTVLRAIYIGEIRGAIEGSTINEWNPALESEYLAAIDSDVGSDSDTDARVGDVQDYSKAVTGAENDPELWLGEQDLVVQEAANRHTHRDVHYAIIESYPEGLSLGALETILEEHAKGLHTHTINKYYLFNKNKAFHRFCVQLKKSGDAVKGLVKKKGGIIKVKPDSGYKASDASKALFGGDKHVCTLLDGIVVDYELIVPIWRKSARKSCQVAFAYLSPGPSDICRVLHNIWELIYNQILTRHQGIAG